MNNSNFIVVKDQDTIQILKNNGFKKFYEDSEMTIFLNKIPLNFNFDEIDQTKLKYTNKLFL